MCLYIKRRAKKNYSIFIVQLLNNKKGETFLLNRHPVSITGFSQIEQKICVFSEFPGVAKTENGL